MDKEATDRMAFFEDMFFKKGRKRENKQTSLHAPFGWPGAKTRSLKQLLELVPQGECYCEPFGGSAALLLARPKARFEVYNDRYSGITAFWRCIEDDELSVQLRERLETTLYSKEYWEFCNTTWHNVGDIVERAARWFYMTKYSFSQLGRNWGRGLLPATSSAGKLLNVLPDFPALHDRLKGVQIENTSWEDIFDAYDQKGMVFYVDPPYTDTPGSTYKHVMSLADHSRLLERIFECQGVVALSGHSHPMIEDKPWNSRHEWDIKSLMEPMADGANNKEKHITRGRDQEVLWIKN